jgi:hypothetical protein
MRAVVGAEIEKAQLGDLSKVADLIYFDGPLLSLFRNGEGENILYHWCDCDDHANRWIVFKIGDQELETFLKGKIPLRSLLEEPQEGFLYCIDLDDLAEQVSAVITSPKQLPAGYLPSLHSFYDDEPVLEVGQRRTTFKVAIDGDWEFSDLHTFPRLFREGYAFTSLFLGNSHAGTIPSLPMRDGFSSMHLFRDIDSSLSTEVRPSLRAVRYASPGAIIFNIDRATTAAYLKVLEAARSGYSSAALSYKFLHGILADKKLLGEDVTKVAVVSANSDEIGKRAVDLARDLKLPHPESLLERAPNTLLAAKVILAFYRLLHDRLLQYERDERMHIPTLP